VRAAEKEVDIVLWDGGNNDLPFYVPDYQDRGRLDPHRPARITVLPRPRLKWSAWPTSCHQTRLTPADPDSVIAVPREPTQAESDGHSRWRRESLRCLSMTPRADSRQARAGDRGRPTLTHGEMAYGAGYVAAAASERPRSWTRSLRRQVHRRPHSRSIPRPGRSCRHGYGDAQMRDLEATINASNVDMVIVGTRST